MIRKVFGLRLSIFLGPLFIIGFVFGVACSYSTRHSLKDHVALLCDIVQEGIYLKSNVMDEWGHHCRARAMRGEFGSSKQKAIWVFDQELRRLPVSHLHTYESDETQSMWENESLDNGLRVRLIEDAFIVVDLVKDSPAEKAGVKPGDQILTVNGSELTTANDAGGLSGTFEIKRLEQSLSFQLKPIALFDDLTPTREILGPGVARLKLASFLPQYYEPESWKTLIAQFKDDKEIVIDLRGNAGGGFPAMLRALSPFFCHAQTIGYLSSDRDAFSAGAAPDVVRSDAMKDDSDTQKQLDALEHGSQLPLQTFADYGCLRASVTALVDAQTSSVAEIFAWALRLRPATLAGAVVRTRVWGVPTAGQVVMARWFDLTPLSFNGVQLSIPIATFLTPTGLELEGEGVTPQRLLFYDLARARAGHDSWIDAAVSK